MGNVLQNQVYPYGISATFNPGSNLNVNGNATFTTDPVIPDEVYGVGWNGTLEPPTKNAVYDKIELLRTETGLSPFLLMGG